MFFGVYYYQITNDNYTYVKRFGFCHTVKEAITTLGTIMPNYRKFTNQTVTNGIYVGWINAYRYGEYDDGDAPITQPSSRYCVDIFATIMEEDLIDNMNSKLRLSTEMNLVDDMRALRFC